MEVKCLVVGNLETNCYLVIKNNECIIIDPGDNAKEIINECKNYNVLEIIVTHHHFDHIGALKELENYFNLKHNTFKYKNLFNYDIIKTPGHTDDSISIYFKSENLLFSGDLVFKNGVGRYDFSNSNYNDLKKSLEFLSNLPEKTIIYPGHGLVTTLKDEKPNFIYY